MAWVLGRRAAPASPENPREKQVWGREGEFVWPHTEFGGPWVSVGVSSTRVRGRQEAPSWVRAQVGGQQGLGWNRSKQQGGFLRTLVPSIPRERKAGRPP